MGTITGQPKGGDLILQGGAGHNQSEGAAGGGDLLLRSGTNTLSSISGIPNGGDIILETGGPNSTFIERVRIMEAGNVGIGTATPASSAALEITSTTKGFLLPRMTTAQRDLISSPATGLTIYNTTKNCNETYNSTSWVSNTHYIGESYGGGIVFYVYDNGQHGLIAATDDQSSGVIWYNGTFRTTGTSGDGLNAGAMNTAMIVATQMADNQSGNFAAKVCADYSVTVDGVTYGDWYLPSKYELNLLYLQNAVVDDFAEVAYWSSSELNNISAYIQFLFNGFQWTASKDSTPYYVRAIRAF